MTMVTATIKGYRQLTPDDQDKINEIKRYGSELGELIDWLAKQPGIDIRWLSIAKTDLQKGFMCLVRAVAKPEGF